MPALLIGEFITYTRTHPSRQSIYLLRINFLGTGFGSDFSKAAFDFFAGFGAGDDCGVRSESPSIGSFGRLLAVPVGARGARRSRGGGHHWHGLSVNIQRSRSVKKKGRSPWGPGGLHGAARGYAVHPIEFYKRYKSCTFHAKQICIETWPHRLELHAYLPSTLEASGWNMSYTTITT